MDTTENSFEAQAGINPLSELVDKVQDSIQQIVVGNTP